MVYTERAPRRQLFHVAPATQQPSSAVYKYTTSMDIQKRAIKGHSHSVTVPLIVQELCESRGGRPGRPS